MVMLLPKPTACGVQLVTDVVLQRAGGKNAAFFQSIQAQWIQHVQDYALHQGSPLTLGIWSAAQSHEKSFLNLYAKPRSDSAQGKALKILRGHKLQLCPACGEAGTPRTLDHYLPKKPYFHFVITPLNLSPMCDICQEEKKQKTDDGVARFFIHPYFDQFSIEQLITLTIQGPYNAPKFTLAANKALTSQEHALVSSHVRELAIESRYADFCITEYRRLLRLVRQTRTLGRAVRQQLEAFRCMREIPSRNSWEHVFYQGVLDDDPLMNHLEHGDLGAYL